MKIWRFSLFVYSPCLRSRVLAPCMMQPSFVSDSSVNDLAMNCGAESDTLPAEDAPLRICRKSRSSSDNASCLIGSRRLLCRFDNATWQSFAARSTLGKSANSVRTVRRFFPKKKGKNSLPYFGSFPNENSYRPYNTMSVSSSGARCKRFSYCLRYLLILVM